MKWGKFLNAYSDLDLDLTKLNIELVRAIFIYYNVFQSRDLDPFLFELSCKNTHTHTYTHYSCVFQKRNYKNVLGNMVTKMLLYYDPDI